MPPHPPPLHHNSRLITSDRALLEHDRHGLGWYDGWDGIFHDTWTDPDDVPDRDDDGDD